MNLPSPLRWGFVFLRCPFHLVEEQQNRLVQLAIQAYIQDVPRVDFDEPCFVGHVRSDSETIALGFFIGQRFLAEVHLPEGSGEVEFLVTEAQLQSARALVAEA